MLLYEFPARYTAVAETSAGSIDELSWLTADAFGDDTSAVPSGAALFVRGWAADLRGSGPAPVVLVRIDDHHVYEACRGASRPDVADALGNKALAACGFEAIVPTGRLAPGSHTVSIAVVEPAENAFAQLAQTATFYIAADGVTLPDLPQRTAPSAGELDEVMDESRDKTLEIDEGVVSVNPGTMLSLRGWTCSTAPRKPFREVYALVNGRRAYRATTGVARADVAIELGDAALELTGFNVQIPTLGLQRGIHEIQILGLGPAGDALVRTPLSVRLRIVGLGSLPFRPQPSG